MEIYNLVFMEYDLQPGNVLVPLPNQNVDTGLGLERTACVLQGVDSVFDTDGFRLIMDWVAEESGVAYERERHLAARAPRARRSRRAPSRFLIAEGIEPSNEGQRLHLPPPAAAGDLPGAADRPRPPATGCPRSSIEQMGDAYPLLARARADIERIVRAEEEKFSGDARARNEGVRRPGRAARRSAAEDAFTLVATYGFPIELAQELAEERGQAIDMDGFRELMEQHREISRGGGESLDAAERPRSSSSPDARPSEFVGYAKTTALTAVIESGAGRRDAAVREARAEPVLRGGRRPGQRHAATSRWTARSDRLEVADVLKFGDDQVLVVDAGGHAPLEPGTRVEAVVNWGDRFPTMANHTATHLLHAALREVLGDHVKQAGSAVRPDKLRFDFTHGEPLTPEQRERVERIVNEKVFEAIPVRTFVTPIEEARTLGAMMLFGEKYGDEVRVVEIDGFSRELCGGTHVRSTAEIGPFVILSEQSVGSGARRIEAVTAGEAWTMLQGRSRELEAVRGELERVRREAKKPKEPEAGPDVVWQERSGRGLRRRGEGRARSGAARPLRPSPPAGGREGRRAGVRRRRQGRARDQPRQVGRREIDAVALVRELGPIIGGGGGGRPTLAEAGGKNVDERSATRSRPGATRLAAALDA